MIRLNAMLLLAATLITSGVDAAGGVVEKLTANINEMTIQSKVSTREIAEEFYSISDNGRCGDVMLLELYVAATLSDEQVDEQMAALDAQGKWADVDYADRKRSRWGPSLHVTRIHSLAKSYKTPSSRHFDSPELSATLHRALKYWFEADLVCPNWWYNEIGGPKMLGPALLLLKDELTPWEMEQSVRIMGRAVLRATGQNKVWLAGNVLMRGLLQNDEALVQQARDSIVSEVYVSTSEGLQPDNSFHQHGAQMQFGNYGLAYAGTVSYWARVFASSPLAVEPDRLGYLRDYLLQGLQWTVWRGSMDVSASGRQVFQSAQRGKAHSVAISMLNMISVDPECKRSYTRYIYENQINTKAENTLVGHKVYPRSDYAVHRTPSWFASVRMHSERLIGFEMTNDENLQGVYSSDGALMLMCDGGEYNDIYPVWDWKYLPGTTVQDDGRPIEYFHPNKPVNDADFVGSVTDSRGGVSAMVLRRDSMMAQKSYFFIGDVVVCLGSGIATGKSLPVHTTLNQCYLRGDVLFGKGGEVSQFMRGSSVLGKDIRWVHHDAVGYVVAQSAEMLLRGETQSGSWSKIAKFYPNEPVEADLFTLSMSHGVKPNNAGYAYFMLPGRTANQTAAFAAKPEVEIVANTTKCQAVTAGKSAQMVFYAPELVVLPSGLKVTAGTAGLAMLERTDVGVNLTVADPTQKLTQFTITLSGKYSGQRAVYDARTKSTTISVDLPTDEGMRGSSVSVALVR